MKHLKPADLANLSQRLRILKSRAVEEIQDASAEVAASLEQAKDEVLDQVEAAEAHRFGDVRLAEIDIDRDTLDEIELAEKRIASGEYGRCVACKAAIPLARLLALPTTARCIDCQSEAEHRAHRP